MNVSTCDASPVVVSNRPIPKSPSERSQKTSSVNTDVAIAFRGEPIAGNEMASRSGSIAPIRRGMLTDLASFGIDAIARGHLAAAP